MPKEQTLFIIKPDAVSNVDVYNRIFYRSMLPIVAIKTVEATPDLIAKHYEHLVDKPFYKNIEAFMTSKPLIVGIFEGSDVIKTWRKILGATDPREAEPGTLRAVFGRVEDDNIFNVAHGSDSLKSAEREIALWFPEIDKSEA